jgi:superoxide dismutase, Fe-Mn family
VDAQRHPASADREPLRAQLRGAVARLNALAQELAALDPASTPPDVISRLKRDELAALNSTLLHELYFASLGGDGRAVPETMAAAMVRDFGSVDRWRREFVALAQSLAGGSGWVLLSYVPRDRRLVNTAGSDHGQTVAGGIPILALDMYEHAYHLEFGANATAYVAAFMRNIDWSAVTARYDDAAKVAPPRPLEQKQFADLPAVTVEDVKAMLASGTPVQIIDPERLDEWIGELSKSAPVVTFCVYGFHIGCETAATLRKAGFDARYMAGGHFGWKAAQGPTRLFDAALPVAGATAGNGQRDAAET